MHFVLPTPSFQHLAGVKIVAHLWSQRDIFTQIARSFNERSDQEPREDKTEWKEIEERVKSKISALLLPEACKKELLLFIKPLGEELIRWSRYHNLSLCSFRLFDSWLPQQLRWTMHGTVDYAKTAELMLKDESLEVVRRYEFACLNSLEDEARQLFESMGEEQKGEYNPLRGGMIRTNHLYMLTFFTCTLRFDHAHPMISSAFFKSRHSPNSSVYRVLFECTLIAGDRAMCEVWFEKLSQREKEQVLEERSLQEVSFERSRASGLLYYLSLMNEEQQRRMFREGSAAELLKGLLRWPMQSLFMEAVKFGWQFMNEGECAKVLGELIVRINRGFLDYNYSELFWECWRLTTADSKPHFLDDRDRLHDLFATKKVEFIKLAFNEAPSHQLEVLVEYSFHRISQAYHHLAESVMSDAELMECKETAALNSTNDPDNEEKRLRSQQVSRFVDKALESRTKSRAIRELLNLLSSI